VEAARTVRDDQRLVAQLALFHRDLARKDKKKAGRNFTGLHQYFARRIGARFAEAGQALHLGGLKHRKHLVVTGDNHGLCGYCHTRIMQANPRTR